MIRRLLLFGWLCAWGVVMWLSWMPVSAPPGVSDKLIHFLVYFLMSLAALSFCRAQTSILLAALVTALLSTVLELGQAYLPYRTFDAGDLAANFAGTASGYLLSAVLMLLAARLYRRPVVR